MARHHHRHTNHHVSHNTNSSGGHSITVTTNRSHGGCSNHIASARAISHPQLTPRTQSSSTASVSVSVTPRRSGGERINNHSANSNNTTNISTPGMVPRECESNNTHNGHRKRAIRDARFPSNGGEMDSERAPKRTTRTPVTWSITPVKREVTLQEDPHMLAGNAGASKSIRERRPKKQEMSSSSAILNTNQECKRSKPTRNKESSCDEICTVTSSTENNETRDTEMSSPNEDVNFNRNIELIAQPCTSSSIKSVPALQVLNSKGEPSKPPDRTTENTNTAVELQCDTNNKRSGKKEENTELIMKKEDKDSVSSPELEIQSINANESSIALNTPESPTPGPSGLQPSSSSDDQDIDSSFAILQNAPDLQLDCLSSDTEDEVNEDVTVVKISRRRKGTSRKKWNANGRIHSERGGSTTTINAPPGTVVEVDLTQESDTDDNEIHVDAIHPPPPLSGPHPSAAYGSHYSMDSVATDNTEESSNRMGGGIKLRRFATAPHGALPPNVQSAGSSRGSTPSSTPGPSLNATVSQNNASNFLGI